jgi:DnaK suppressor protein
MSSISKVKAQLEAKLRELEERVERIDYRLGEPGVADWEENAALHSNDEVLTGLGELTEKDIHEIRLALQRIESGTYGKCVVCGAVIPRERLSALPFTTKCVACAS